ncbi:MAG: hypothetical protein ACI8RZ_001111 [Myxococcota bacterium]|jgi:hypothetical protein
MLLTALLLLGCTDAPPVVPPTPQPPPVEAPPPPPPISPDDVTVEIVDPLILAELDAGGLGLAALLGAPQPPPRPTTAWMTANSPRYQQLAVGWGSEAETLAARLDRDLVVDHRDATRWPASNVGRRLDPRWFSSDKAFFQLIGVINRLDRTDFIGGCGEVRLLYRLAYQTETEAGVTVGSRLPVTVNAVLSWPEEDGCVSAAQWWAGDQADRLAKLQSLPLKQVEFNAQIVRFPSGVETQFAGQALYLLKVYADQGGTMVARPLENTPDVDRIRADPALRAELLDFITTHLDDIGDGVYQLPESLLTTTALSWSTLGINRSANKPFDALLDVEDLPTGGYPDTLGSGAEAIERLNAGTCMGCHQAASTAGFHFLGADDEAVSGITNRLQLPFSAHYHRELDRRRAHVADLGSGRDPDRHRPHPLAPAPNAAGEPPDVGSNAACVPEVSRDLLAKPWGCAEAGEVCTVVAGDAASAVQFGQCVPEDVAGLSSGMTCRAGTVTGAERTDSPFNLHAYRDSFSSDPLYDLPEDKRFFADSYNCRPTVIGVPLGRAYRRCTTEERALTATTTASTEICAVVGGSKFDQCVEGDFHSCLAGIVGRGMVDSCHIGRFCREDYICQSLPHQLSSVPDEAGQAVSAAGVGFCTPTYFLFQLRLDGHPTP